MFMMSCSWIGVSFIDLLEFVFVIEVLVVFDGLLDFVICWWFILGGIGGGMFGGGLDWFIENFNCLC